MLKGGLPAESILINIDTYMFIQDIRTSSGTVKLYKILLHMTTKAYFLNIERNCFKSFKQQNLRERSIRKTIKSSIFHCNSSVFKDTNVKHIANFVELIWVLLSYNKGYKKNRREK